MFFEKTRVCELKNWTPKNKESLFDNSFGSSPHSMYFVAHDINLKLLSLLLIVILYIYILYIIVAINVARASLKTMVISF